MTRNEKILRRLLEIDELLESLSAEADRTEYELGSALDAENDDDSIGVMLWCTLVDIKSVLRNARGAFYDKVGTVKEFIEHERSA